MDNIQKYRSRLLAVGCWRLARCRADERRSQIQKMNQLSPAMNRSTPREQRTRPALLPLARVLYPPQQNAAPCNTQQLNPTQTPRAMQQIAALCSIQHMNAPESIASAGRCFYARRGSGGRRPLTWSPPEPQIAGLPTTNPQSQIRDPKSRASRPVHENARTCNVLLKRVFAPPPRRQRGGRNVAQPDATFSQFAPRNNDQCTAPTAPTLTLSRPPI